MSVRKQPEQETQEFEPIEAREPEGDRRSRNDGGSLLPPKSDQHYRDAWQSIQVGFVDEPRNAVERADHLVAELMRELSDGFAKARSSLEAEWGRGEEASTEELRTALRRYRTFFERLLAA